jgi:hypothetical protein
MSREFELFEGSNGFYLYDLVTEREKCIGDGVDEEFNGLTVGMPGFTEAWQEHINENGDLYLEAYFPELYHMTVKFDLGDQVIVYSLGELPDVLQMHIVDMLADEGVL